MKELSLYYFDFKDIARNCSLNDAKTEIEDITIPANLYQFVKNFNWWQLICIFPFAKGIVGGDCTFYTEIPACLKDDANSIAMLLHDYLIPKIWNFTIAVSDNDTIEGNADIDDFIQRAGAWLASTFPAYDVRINAFNSLKTKLLDEVSSESINKFNDAPQTPYIAGETDGDDHLTNLTKNIQTSQVTTNANRLAEIDDAIKNIYLEWVDDFVQTFIIM